MGEVGWGVDRVIVKEGEYLGTVVDCFVRDRTALVNIEHGNKKVNNTVLLYGFIINYGHRKQV